MGQHKEQRLFFPFFAHSIDTFDTRLETMLMLFISHHFRICEDRVESPNQPHHEEGNKLWMAQASRARMTPKAMGYFHEVVFPECDGPVALPFLDGRMGFDVASYMQWFIKEGLPAFVIFPTEKVTPDSLRRFETNFCSGLFELRQLTEEEKILVLADDPRFVLSHGETPQFYPSA